MDNEQAILLLSSDQRQALDAESCPGGKTGNHVVWTAGFCVRLTDRDRFRLVRQIFSGAFLGDS